MERSTHIREIRPIPPTCIGSTDTSLTGMGVICHSPIGQHFFWRLPAGRTTAQWLLSDANPGGDLVINDLELATYVTHQHIFAPLMAPLEHIKTKADNMSE